MGTRCKIYVDHLLVLIVSESVYVYSWVHSETCQTRSFRTEMRVLRPFCINYLIRFSRFNVVNDNSSLVPLRAVRYFSVDQKSSSQKFSTRPARQRPHDIVSSLLRASCYKSIQNACYGYIQHVRYEDRLSNSRNLENSPFLSRKRDEHVVKTCVEDRKMCK